MQTSFNRSFDLQLFFLNRSLNGGKQTVILRANSFVPSNRIDTIQQPEHEHKK